MADPPPKMDKSSPSDEYIRLGIILQKERSPVKQAVVDRILKSRAPLEKKIKEIIAVDHKDDRQLRVRRRDAMRDQVPEAPARGEDDDLLTERTGSRPAPEREADHVHEPIAAGSSPGGAFEKSGDITTASDERAVVKKNRFQLLQPLVENGFFRFLFHDYALSLIHI